MVLMDYRQVSSSGGSPFIIKRLIIFLHHDKLQVRNTIEHAFFTQNNQRCVDD